MKSMELIFQPWPLCLLLIFGWISCFSKVEGLKCYICNGETGGEGCKVSVSKKSEFLKECNSSAIACGTISVETAVFDPPIERWFQRSCIYPYDGYSFYYYSTLPGRKGKVRVHHAFRNMLDEANERRRKYNLTEMEQPSESLFELIKSKRNYDFLVQTCEEGEGDGCNSWDGGLVFPHAEGFPDDKHEERIQLVNPIKCYSCSTGDFPYHKDKNCRDIQTISDSIYKKIFSRLTTSYGCATLSIYQIAGGRQPYFERNAWFPGDSWCMEKRYPSSPTARSLVQYMSKKGAGNKTGGRSGEESCRQGYTRALKRRHSKGRSAEPFSDEESYIWSGKREFVSVEEFTDFLECRYQLRERYRLRSKNGKVETEIKFLEDEAKSAFAGKSGPFASVGFHFCGPYDYCNDWSEEHLQEESTTKKRNGYKTSKNNYSYSTSNYFNNSDYT